MGLKEVEALAQGHIDLSPGLGDKSPQGLNLPWVCRVQWPRGKGGGSSSGVQVSVSPGTQQGRQHIIGMSIEWLKAGMSDVR